MAKKFSAAGANRQSVVVNHGKPVAKVIPVNENDLAAERARSAIFARLKKERVVKSGRWTRDELYGDAR